MTTTSARQVPGDGAPTRPFTVLVMQPLPTSSLEYLRSAPMRVLEAHNGDAWRDHAAEVDALIYYSIPIDRPLLDELPNLRVIGKRGAGIDTVDLDATRSRGILITNIQGADGNAVSVAEHAVALLLSARRQIVARDALTRRGGFASRHTLPMCREVSGSNVGLVGAGHIGRRIGNMMRGAFDCVVGYYDPYLTPITATEFGGTQFDSLGDLFEWADSVLVAAPLTSETRGMIGAREIRLLGPEGVLVVISRGGIVDEGVLAAALERGEIAAAGIDVYDGEPPKEDNPLFACDRAVLTPHVAGATRESRERTSLSVCRQVHALLTGGEAPLADQPWLVATGPAAGDQPVERMPQVREAESQSQHTRRRGT